MAFQLKAGQRITQTIALTHGRLLRIDRARGSRIVAGSGTLLLTMFNHPDEIILDCGNDLTLINDQLTLVEAIGDSMVILHAPTRSTTPLNGIFVRLRAVA